MCKIYKLVGKEYKNVDGYQHRILWDVKAIAKKSNANGYIVQRVDANTTSPEIEMEKKPYFEAWRVTDGLTGNSNYDDEFWAMYLEADGEATYQTEVYWIDIEDELYSIVDRWKNGAVRMANELPSSYEFQELGERELAGKRFFHWDSKDYK